MRQPASGPVNSQYIYTFPAGTAIGPNGGSAGTTVPVLSSPNDNVIANWDRNSFGPKGPLLLEASLATDVLGIVTIWNWTANPIVTGTDLTVIVQVIPGG